MPGLHAVVMKSICDSVMAQLATLPATPEGYTQDVLCALAAQREQTVSTSVRGAEALVRALPSPPPPELHPVLGALIPCTALFCAISSFIGTQRHSRALKDEKALTWLRNTRTSWFVFCTPHNWGNILSNITSAVCFQQWGRCWLLLGSANPSARPDKHTAVDL